MARPDIPAIPVPVSAARRSITRRIWRVALASSEFRVGARRSSSVLVLAALLFPELTGLGPTKMSVKDAFHAAALHGRQMELGAPLGTDQLGRDLLMRCLIGLRYALLHRPLHRDRHVRSSAARSASLAGYRGGWVDMILMRLTDAQLSIPLIILAITILGVSRPTIPAIILVLGLVGLAGLCPGHAQRRHDRAQAGICARRQDPRRVGFAHHGCACSRRTSCRRSPSWRCSTSRA